MIISIVGGGIGGLTLALALKANGFKVKIYEAAKEVKTVGAGIILGCNAMQVYQQLGIAKHFADKGNPVESMSITNQKLKDLSDIQLDFFVKKYGIGNHAIHRADLHQVLLDQLDQDELKLGKKLKSLDVLSNQLQFEDGQKESYDILIGADGIHSKVRESIFPNKSKIRKAGQVCWRGVVDYKLPNLNKNQFREAWGIASRFGHGQINEKQVYWFALLNFEGELKDYDNPTWRKYFDDYDPLVKDLLNITPDDQIHIGEMTELTGLDDWYSGNVCLIGDAAHAMTPNMGQGAGQAIEDGLALTNSLKAHNDNVEKAFSSFQVYRKKKVDKIVKNSWMIGNIAQLQNPFLCGFRNAFMRTTPAFVGRNALKETFDI